MELYIYKSSSISFSINYIPFIISLKHLKAFFQLLKYVDNYKLKKNIIKKKTLYFKYLSYFLIFKNKLKQIMYKKNENKINL